MMNNDLLLNIEYLRERANVSYEEAEKLLTQFDGNVMRVLVELERQGRVYSQPAADEYEPGCTCDAKEAKHKAVSFWNKAMSTRVIIEKKGKNGEKETLVNLSAPLVAGAAVIAPYLALASAAVACVAGNEVKIVHADQKEKEEI